MNSTKPFFSMWKQVISVVFVCLSITVAEYISGTTMLQSDPCEKRPPSTLVCTDHIPKDFDPEIKAVVLREFSSDISFNRSTFNASSWNFITNLTIENTVIFPYITKVYFGIACFDNMENLTNLFIHVRKAMFVNGSFHGLDNVELLDLGGTNTISDGDIYNILGQGSLSKLKILLMVNFDLTLDITLDEPFWKAINDRPIYYLDLSSALHLSLNMTSLYRYCDSLNTLVMRKVKVIDSKIVMPLKPFCKGLRELIMSGTVFHDQSYCNDTLPPNVPIPLDLDILFPFAAIEKVEADGMCTGNTNSHSVHGIIISFVSKIKFNINLKDVSVKRNRLVFMDVVIKCEHPTLQTLSLAENEMQFLNPGAISCVFTLRHLDLADNSLEYMRSNNHSMFSHLFTSLYNLEFLNLAKNGFRNLPSDIFVNNTNITTINLSRNQLVQVEFSINSNRGLRTLDLSENKIAQLNNGSRRILSDILATEGSMVDLGGNPLSCGSCDDLESTSWLVKYKTSIRQFSDLVCINEHGDKAAINEEAINQIQEICNRTRTLLIWCSVGVGSLLVVACITMAYRKVIIIKRRRSNRNMIIDKLQHSEDGFQYAVFLTFSSQNEDIVQNLILPHLQTELSRATNIDRKLICIGDEHFRLGYPVASETIRCMKMTHVVVCIITDEFCNSEYCANEFTLACQINKRVILMIKENTNIEMMPTDLREMFHHNTRIVWSLRDGILMLKTSWDNVSSSILEL